MASAAAVSATTASSPGYDLIESLLALNGRRLPAATVEAARLRLLDCLGCGIFGAQFEWTEILAAFALDDAPSGVATLLGSDRRTSPSRAALCNGTSIHGYELDDILPGSLAHPGAPVAAAALAVAEQIDAPVERLLCGLVAGYEIIARLGDALGTSHNDRGFHTTGVTGPIAAAVAASVVAGASINGTLRAVGLAASFSSGIKAFTQGTGGMVKRLHAGRAAESGVLAFEIAARGFTAPLRALDGRFGLLEVFAGTNARPDALSEGIGGAWAIERVWTKVYPSCGLLHTAAEAVENIRRDTGASAADVHAIRIGLGRRAIAQNGDPNPTDTITAQYSIPFSAALAMAGDAKDPEAYGPGRIYDPTVRALIGRIELHVDPEVDAAYPAMFAADVEIELRDGARHRSVVWNVHGTPESPCDEAELEAKFDRLTRGRIDGVTARDVLDGLRQASASVRDLQGTLRAATARAAAHD